MKEFDKIIGYSAIKKELKQVADTLKNGEIYAKLGVSAPKGLLLHGDPGVGKTLMAGALIEASGRTAHVCRKNQPNGDFIKAIKETFRKAAETAPSIVFLDDMDKFANGDERHRDAEEYVTVQSCIDEVKGKEVFVLATANCLRNLPDSLLRAGRFDRIIQVGTPTGQDAVRIIDHYLQGKPFVSGVDAKTIAKILDGHSCAELETVINEAGLYAGFDRSACITMDHFMEACMRTVFDVPAAADDDEDWYTNLWDGNSITTQIVYHEAGHAVISEILNPESVTLISAHSRKGGSGGFTAYYNAETVNPWDWQESRIIGGLGGMAALDQKFGITGSGASRDLDRVFSWVRDRVTEECTCGFGLHSGGHFGDSEDLQARQEQAVATEVEKYYRKAKEILARNGEFFEKLAAALARKKLLNAQDVQEIKAACPIVSVSL